jgi:diaminohydroxyphosphoribosylaminopyrimidine deaminase/5-amino-6-(5-phosphoribosylamino)uracil reductase
MQRALVEAARARGHTHPNPLVGCVVAHGPTLIAVGHHRRAGGPHAEVVALRRAGARARGADVYVTLEPCSHVGRTGPCADALIAAGVRRVFVGSRDPNPQVLGRGIRRLRAAGIEVQVGLLAAQCRSLNAAFFFAMAHGRPKVTAKLAQSLDGRVATATGESKWITGPAARRHGHLLRGLHDAILVGVGTVLADDPRLTNRSRHGRNPRRIVLDTQARTPPTAKLLRPGDPGDAPPLICTGPQASAQHCARLQRRGAQILPCSLNAQGRVDVAEVLQGLAQREVRSVLLEGGPTVLGAFFDAGLVDHVQAYLSASIIGGEQALSSVLGQGTASLTLRHRLRHLQWQALGPDLLLSGEVARRTAHLDILSPNCRLS